MGCPDVLVNNAGITRDGLILRMKDSGLAGRPRDESDRSVPLQQGVSSPDGAGAPGSHREPVERRGSGLGNPGQANYCASKAGLEGLTRSLAREYANRNVRVNAVAPGFIVTDMTEALGEKAREALISQVPLARLGSPRDVAEAVAFLASDRAAYITGHVLHVNGGMYMG